MIFHINSIESFSAHPDGHSCLVLVALRLAAGKTRHGQGLYRA